MAVDNRGQCLSDWTSAAGDIVVDYGSFDRLQPEVNRRHSIRAGLHDPECRRRAINTDDPTKSIGAADFSTEFPAPDDAGGARGTRVLASWIGLVYVTGLAWLATPRECRRSHSTVAVVRVFMTTTRCDRPRSLH